jgi:hypothetical protein
MGEREEWSNHLGSRLLDQALKIEQSITKAAYQMTASFPGIGQGRCKCGAVKSLKFKIINGRVLKQAMKSGGSNLTQQHAEDLSFVCAISHGGI